MAKSSVVKFLPHVFLENSVNFIVRALTFRSLSQFELIWVHGVR